MAIAHGLPLGAGPRPSSGDEFATRLRASATASLAGAPISGLDAATISARLDGADIEALDLDLAGVAIAPPSPTVDSAHPSAPLAPSPEVSRERGARRLLLEAEHGVFDGRGDFAGAGKVIPAERRDRVVQAISQCGRQCAGVPQP